MSYGLLGVQGNMEDQALQGLGQTAQIQRENKMHEASMKEAQKTKEMSGTASGAMIGLMAGGPIGGVVGAGVGFLAGRFF